MLEKLEPIKTWEPTGGDKIAETKRQWETFHEEVVGSEFRLRSGFNHCPLDRGMGGGGEHVLRWSKRMLKLFIRWC